MANPTYDAFASLPQAGGFFQPSSTMGLPSPAPSATSTRSATSLPRPRGKSLQPGTNKEDMVRRYIEDRLLYISRRYVKKFGQPDPRDDVVGYKGFGEVCKDLDGVVNVLWLSGTRERDIFHQALYYSCMTFNTLTLLIASLQIPFLLKIGSDITQYVRSFPPSSRASFDLLRKLDHCFSSLLCGRDLESQEGLPGFENGLRSGMTTTDMVRCRSLVEQTRVLMVEVLSSQVEEEEEEEGEDEFTDTEFTETEDENVRGTQSQAFGWEDDDEGDEVHLDAARIYENTIVQLGNRLGDSLGGVLGSSVDPVCGGPMDDTED